VQQIPIDHLTPNPRQPRASIEEAEIEDLVASVREHGVLQPLVVRRMEEETYEIVAGERRWRAARAAGLKTVPCVVRDTDEATSLVLALVENLQREDLNAMEAAQGYQQLIEQFGMTQEQVAQRVGKSRTAVANTLRLLQLPEAVQAMIREGRLSEGHGRALLGVQEPPERIAELAEEATQLGLSVRELEQIAQESRDSGTESSTALTPSAPRRSRKPLPPELEDVRQRLQTALATAVRLRPRRQGGIIEIEYYDDEDLTRLLELFGA